MKTGSGDRPWVVFDTPKPPAVDDRYRYWSEPPSTTSDRCAWWLAQIERGWRPNKYVRHEGYDSSAAWYGVYIWEYLHLIQPALDAADGPRGFGRETP